MSNPERIDLPLSFPGDAPRPLFDWEQPLVAADQTANPLPQSDVEVSGAALPDPDTAYINPGICVVNPEYYRQAGAFARGIFPFAED